MSSRFFGDSDWIPALSVPASRRVFIYSETQLNDTNLQSLKNEGKRLGHEIQFRSQAYVTGRSRFEVPLAFIMPAAVTDYERIRKRYPNLSGQEDYLFFPKYQNRNSAKRIAQRQFNALLKRCNLKQNPMSGYKHSLYSLHHTAICMRLTLSKSHVNIYSLATNSGTSVDQIERFYARNLPLPAELVRKLQSFGNG